MSFPPDILEEAARLHVNLSEVEEQFVRGGGAGGQKINKTSSCVVLNYRNFSVRCQRHREREKNRISAYRLLFKKVELMRLGRRSEIAKKQFKLRKQKQRRSRRSKERMLADKAHRSGIKALRAAPQ